MPVKSDERFEIAVQHRQTVALGGVAGELVQLVRDGVVEEALHVATHVIEGAMRCSLFLSACQSGEKTVVPLLGRFSVSSYLLASKYKRVRLPPDEVSTGRPLSMPMTLPLLGPDSATSKACFQK